MDNGKSIQPVTLQLIQANTEEDEISLYDIFQILAEYKFHIASITFVCTLAALIYAIQVPPVYQANAYLIPPRQQDIEGLNLYEIEHSPRQVFQYYIKNFESLSLRKKFFEENDLFSLLVKDKGTRTNFNKVLDESFNKQLDLFIDEESYRKGTVQFKSRDEGPLAKATAQFKARDAKYSSEWLNKFIDFLNQETVNNIKHEISISIGYKIEEITRTINDKRDIAIQNRLDEVQRLSEADNVKSNDIKNKIMTLKEKARIEFEDKMESLRESKGIADKLNIINPSLPSASVPSDANDEKMAGLMINAGNIPEYMRGIKALNVEIESIEERKDNEDAFTSGLRDLERELELLKENSQLIALKNRENDDPYIYGLSELQNKIKSLKTIIKKIEMDTIIKAVIVDKYAIIPYQRIKPNRRKIVMLGLFVGVVSGIFFAIGLNFIKSNLQQKKQI